MIVLDGSALGDGSALEASALGDGSALGEASALVDGSTLEASALVFFFNAGGCLSAGGG